MILKNMGEQKKRIVVWENLKENNGIQAFLQSKYSDLGSCISLSIKPQKLVKLLLDKSKRQKNL